MTLLIILMVWSLGILVTMSWSNSFQNGLKGKLVLAPLTRGGNLAFRRLCADFGATHTMSEMAIARNLFRGYHKAIKKERALCRKAEADNSLFGFQIATKSSDEAIRASQFAKENGADWIDLNCGCPIWEATSKGLGVSLLKKPDRLFKMVNLFTAESVLPVSVKIRIGVSDSKVNVNEVVEGLREAGAQAVTIHGRSGEARYSKPANWSLLSDVARKHHHALPIIGNGDILTHYECENRLAGGDVDGLMTGRGALIKPWIFKEFIEGKSYDPTPEERVAIYHRLAQYFKEQFGDDDFGKRHAFYFLPWHFNFFCRYRAISKADHDYLYSVGAPPIQNSRALDDYLRVVDPHFDNDELETLLRNEDPAIHLEISNILWRSPDPHTAVSLLNDLAGSPQRVSFLIEAAEAASAAKVANDERSWVAGGSGPRTDDNGRKSGGQQTRKQLHANNHEVINDVDRCMFHLEMRAGKVVEVSDHPSATQLQVNVVDLGEENGGKKRIITGRKGQEDNFLQDLDVIVLCNIREAVLCGERSEAMILFSNDAHNDSYSPLLAPSGTLPGSLVTFQEKSNDDGTCKSEAGSHEVTPMNSLLRRESRKVDFKSVSSGRLHKSMKKGLRNCFSEGEGGGKRVVYKTSGVRKNWELVVMGGEEKKGTVSAAPVMCMGEGRVC